MSRINRKSHKEEPKRLTPRHIKILLKKLKIENCKGSKRKTRIHIKVSTSFQKKHCKPEGIAKIYLKS